MARNILKIQISDSRCNFKSQNFLGGDWTKLLDKVSDLNQSPSPMAQLIDLLMWYDMYFQFHVKQGSALVNLKE